MYLNSEKLNSTVLWFSATDDISDYRVYSLCQTKTEFLYTEEKYYYYKLTFLDTQCTNKNFYLQDQAGNILLNTQFSLNLLSDFVIYNKFVDYPTSYLQKSYEVLQTWIDKNQWKDWTIWRYLNFSQQQKERKMDEHVYLLTILEHILEQRKQLYMIPVDWKFLPDGKNLSKFPNTARPYRASYTNGIHEWWDIDAAKWTHVRAIDDAIVVKVIRDFKFSDLAQLQTGSWISQEEKITNLDILRWNQVWLKTMKGDVIFYAHLESVNSQIQVGDVILKGMYLWNVGATWVPDQDYKDYHLHFELKKNPYSIKKAWKNTLFDYMMWDWYLKGETTKTILEQQYNIFKK